MISAMQDSDIENLHALLCEHFRAPKLYTVSEWSDSFRILSSKASAEPGRWRTSRAPYLKEIMDQLSVNSPMQDITFMKSSQVGGTECGNNWLGYIIDFAPGPTMLVQPTLALAKRNSKQRIQPLIDENERLSQKVAPTRTNDSGNTILEKDFPGGVMVMTGANSAAGLRSMPAKNLFLDEIDAYPHDAEGEGDPISLVEKRSSTFSKRKIFKVSTPTIEGMSKIAYSFDQTDQRRYFMPCPHCEHFQHLQFKNLVWPPNEPKKAQYQCDSCNKFIENWQKTSMFKKAYWLPTKPENADPKRCGFHINALYAPVGWMSWGEIAEQFLKSKDDPVKLKTFINTVLGETFKEKSERPDWNRLWERRENYAIGKVPKGAVFLTCGVDVQKDRLEAEVIGWGREKVSWSIDFRVFMGDTSQDAVWKELEKLLHEFFPMAENDKIRLPIKLMGVDSGYNTQMVYSWVRKFSATKVVAMKGRDNLGVIISKPTPVDVTTSGKTMKRGLKVWSVGVNLVKSELYGYLRQPSASEGAEDFPGFCHFPEYGEEFFKQLTAEQMVSRFVKGYKITEWQKIRERNEALDCRIYGRAAAAICGLDRFTEEKWQAMEKDSFIPVKLNAANQEIPQIQKLQSGIKIERRKSNWL